MRKVIALVGSASVGKTTVFEILKNKFPKYEFINESTRTVSKYGYRINEGGSDNTQLAIAAFHLKALLQPYNLILDRCMMDALVYTRVTEVTESTRDYMQHIWDEVKDAYTHFIYFPIEFAAVDDGVRSVNEEWRKQIDDEFKVELDKLGRDYLTVTGSPMQRVKQIIDHVR